MGYHPPEEQEFDKVNEELKTIFEAFRETQKDIQNKITEQLDSEYCGKQYEMALAQISLDFRSLNMKLKDFKDAF